jgi:hypothetical protein
MHSYSAALRISGKKLVVTEVSAKLRLEPSQVRIAGQPRPGGRSVWDESMWEYRVWANKRNSKGDWSSLEKALLKIISTFEPHSRFLRHYQRRFEVLLWCGHFSSSFDGGPTFSPSLLKRLGDFGVELFLDTYFSGTPQ